MPRMDQQHLKQYINLLRDRNTMADALGAANDSLNQARGLQNNWVGGPKYKAQQEARIAAMPVEDRITYEDQLARDVVRFKEQEKRAAEQKQVFTKGLAAKEQQLVDFKAKHPDIGVISLDEALNLLGTDPSADTTPTERLAEAASTELANIEATEAVASSKS